MIKTTIYVEDPEIEDASEKEIDTVFPCIPPPNIEIFIDSLEDVYTLKEVTYNYGDNSLSLYVFPYKPR